LFIDGTAGLAKMLDGEALGPARRDAPTHFDIDSRRLKAGGLFFALAGSRSDGHTYLKSLAGRDAWGAVVSDRDKALASGLPCVLVGDVPEALLQLAALRRKLLKFPIVAITGTNGKTSTKDLLYQVFSRKRKVCGTRGNFNNLLGLPLSILAAPEDAELGLFEMGMSTPGEIDRLAALAKPDYGIITNVSLAHVEGLGNLEGVRQAKGELIPHLDPKGILYLNGDDPSSQFFRARAGERQVRQVTTRGVIGAGVSFTTEKVELRGVTGEVCLDIPGTGRQAVRTVRWPIPGRHMVYPLLFALALAQDLGLELSLEELDDAFLAQLLATPGRMRIRTAGDITVVDDSYNANPASMKAAMEYLTEVKLPGEGRKFCLLGDMLELGDASKSSHRALYERVGRVREFVRVWVVGEEFQAAMQGSGEIFRHVKVSGNREEVLRDLTERMRLGDVILIKGSRGIGLDFVSDGLCRFFREKA
jgi:UDP-N-acetylmuramoyl-tripeptide--D-alanyl-D-alanine ligase